MPSNGVGRSLWIGFVWKRAKSRVGKSLDKLHPSHFLLALAVLALMAVLALVLLVLMALLAMALLSQALLALLALAL